MHLAYFLWRFLFLLLYRFVLPDCLREHPEFSPFLSEEVLCLADAGLIRYEGGDTLCMGEKTGLFTLEWTDGDPNFLKPRFTVFRINEIEVDNPGTDQAEFIEIAGPADSSLSGMVLVLFNGNAGSPQNAAYRVIDLDRFRTDSCGFFLVRGPSVADPDASNPYNDTLISVTGGFLQNGPDAVALYKKDAYVNGTGPVLIDLVDAVVYHNAPGDPDSDLLADLGQAQQYVDKQQGSLARSPDISGLFINDSTTSPGQINLEGKPYEYIWLLTRSDSILVLQKTGDTADHTIKFQISGPGTYQVYGLSVRHGLFTGMDMDLKTIQEIRDTLQNGFCASLSDPYPITVRPALQFLGTQTTDCSSFDSTGRFQVDIKWLGPALFPMACPDYDTPLEGTRYSSGDTLCFRTSWIPGGDSLCFALIDEDCKDTVRGSVSRFCDFCGILKAPEPLSRQGLCTDEWYTVIPTGGGLEQVRQATGLIFSEYLEGSGNNKCLELFNGTLDTIDLLQENYVLEIYFNGQEYPLETISLEGRIDPGAVYTICHNLADSIPLSRADQVSGALDFNGDDALVLKRMDKVADRIGRVGEDPGSQWGSGLTSTQDNTLIRNGLIYIGDSLVRDPFFPEHEWTGYLANDFDDLGKHQYTAVQYVAESYIFYSDETASPGSVLHIGDTYRIRLRAGALDTLYYAAHSLTYGCSSLSLPLVLSASPDNIVCKRKVQVALDPFTCVKTISSDEVVENPGFCKFSIRVSYPFGTNRWAEGNILDRTHAGLQLVYQAVRHDGNSCWGYLQASGPVSSRRTCLQDTMNCYEWYGVTWTQGIQSVPCTKDSMIVVSQSYVDSGCASGFLGTWSRSTLFKNGNIQTGACKDIVHIVKPVMAEIDPPESLTIDCDLVRGTGPEALTPEQLIELQGFGIISSTRRIVPQVSGYRIFPVPGPGCVFIPTYSDVTFALCGNSFVIRRQWNIRDWCTGELATLIQYITIQDKKAPRPALSRPVLMGETDPHDCMGTLSRIRPLRFTDCSALQTWFESEYIDPGQPWKRVHFRSERISDLNLPEGNHVVEFYALDACGFSAKAEVEASIYDRSAPEAVCKSGLTMSSDPATCWARIYAEDLDDGSRDGCKTKLHFAVASMGEMDYWKKYWLGQLKERLGPVRFEVLKDQCFLLTDHWINTWVFRDYANLQKPGTHPLIFRVYEASSIPRLDPHLFNGGSHLWYCYNAYALARLEINWLASSGASPDLFWPEGQFSDSLLQVLEDSIFQAPGPIYEKARPLPVCEGNPKIGASGMNGCPGALYQDCFTAVTLTDKIPPRAEEPEDLWLFNDGAETGRACNKNHEKPSWRTGDCLDPFHKPLGQVVLSQNDQIIKEDPRGHPFGYYGCNPNDRLILDENGRRLVPCDDRGVPVYCPEWLLQDRFDHIGPDAYERYFYRPAYDQASHKVGRTFRISDPCGLDSLAIRSYDTSSIDSCGSGWITRTWTLVDPSGNKTFVDQSLFLRPRSDFEVIFPADTLLFLTPHTPWDSPSLKAPLILDRDVESLVSTYTDEWFIEGKASEGLVLRTWTVKNDCMADFHPHAGPGSEEVLVDDRLVADPLKRPCVYRYLKDGGDGVMVYTQVIRLIQDSKKERGVYFDKTGFPKSPVQWGAGNALLQNHPNPFNRQSVIGISLERQAWGRLMIFSTAGRLLKCIEKEWAAGRHEVWIERNDLGGTGVFYYYFESGFFRAGRKMLIIE